MRFTTRGTQKNPKRRSDQDSDQLNEKWVYPKRRALKGGMPQVITHKDQKMSQTIMKSAGDDKTRDGVYPVEKR